MKIEYSNERIYLDKYPVGTLMLIKRTYENCCDDYDIYRVAESPSGTRLLVLDYDDWYYYSQSELLTTPIEFVVLETP